MSFSISFNSLFSILYCLIAILSEVEARLECFVSDVDEFGFPRPYTRRVVYCNSQHEACCKKGCCAAQTSWYIWPLIIIGAIVVSIICGCIHMYNGEHCKNMSGNKEEDQEGRSLPINDAAITSPLAPTETGGGPREIAITLLPHQHKGSISDLHLTRAPPPTYNVAIYASQQNLNHTIPSYEHVVKGKNS